MKGVALGFLKETKVLESTAFALLRMSKNSRMVKIKIPRLSLLDPEFVTNYS